MSNSFSCIVVEDELIYQKNMINFIGEVDYLKLKGVFNSPIEIKDQIDLDKIDIVFLDIMMPGENGLEFAESLQKNNSEIIFTTSKAAFAIHAFDLNACDYLVKPIEIERFKKSVEKAKLSLEKTKLGQLNKIKDIKPENILYFTKEANRIAIHHKNGVFHLKNSLKSVLANMNDARFVRIHKSFGVNVQAITKIAKDRLFIDDKSLPISRQGKLKLMKKMDVF